jgi:hypothetical protein
VDSVREGGDVLSFNLASEIGENAHHGLNDEEADGHVAQVFVHKHPRIVRPALALGEHTSHEADGHHGPGQDERQANGLLQERIVRKIP